MPTLLSCDATKLIFLVRFGRDESTPPAIEVIAKSESPFRPASLQDGNQRNDIAKVVKRNLITGWEGNTL